MSDNDVSTMTADRAGRGAADLDGMTGGTFATATEPGAPASQAAQAPGSDVAAATLDDIEEALKDVIDPELGINVVDLGLIYDLQVDSGNVCLIDMTLTSAACPLQEMIEDQVCAALTGGPTPVVADYRINWVWLPPWGPEKITDDGRDQLRAIGFNI
ncbi:MAG: metal-sulfur cluster biosynthesis protein [Actinobacteria bacterium 69-20]|nr:metal-sulfur cluster assembly factor [Actinomycetota bacterium]OJV30320.1 MAG: metal-sulfur cluster biosynthesis protein [Actinobacteria bacterium 69-20]